MEEYYLLRDTLFLVARECLIILLGFYTNIGAMIFVDSMFVGEGSIDVL